MSDAPSRSLPPTFEDAAELARLAYNLMRGESSEPLAHWLDLSDGRRAFLTAFASTVLAVEPPWKTA